MTKKNILYVIHGYPPAQHAGTENYSYSLAKEIAKKQFNVGAFYPIYCKKLKKKKLVKKPINNHTGFELHTNECSILNNMFNEEIENIFYSVVKSFSPDIIHFQHTHAVLPTSLLLQTLNLKKKIIITLHDFWYLCPKTYMLNNDGTLCDGPTTPQKCAKCFLESEVTEWNDNEHVFNYTVELFAKRLEISRLIFSMANLTTAPSKFLLDKYKQFVTFRQSLRLPLGLDTPTHLPTKTFSKSTRFGFLGNISPLKNVHGLINSFSGTTGNATLHIYGKMNEGHLSNTLSYLAARDSRIKLHGPYAPNDLDNILSQIDIGIVPSFFENYPLVVREFLNAEIPVIASGVGGIPEIITHNKNGLLFDPLNDNSLQDSIQQIIDYPCLIKNLGKNITKIKNINQDASVWAEIYRQS